MAERKRFSVGIPAGEDGAAALAELLACTASFARKAGLPPETEARLAIVVEELASNAIRHGGAGAITLEIAARSHAIAIAISDDGVAFDSSRTSDFEGPDPETGGGVGLQIVRSWCSSFEYRRVGNQNAYTAQLSR